MSWVVNIEVALNLAPSIYLDVLSKTCTLRECTFEMSIVGGNPPLGNDLSTLVYHSIVNRTVLKTYNQTPAWGYLFSCKNETAY